MNWSTIKPHIIDMLKGLIAAAVVAFGTQALNYIGAHIPDMLQFLATWAAGFAGVKASTH